MQQGMARRMKSRAFVVESPTRKFKETALFSWPNKKRLGNSTFCLGCLDLTCYWIWCDDDETSILVQGEFTIFSRNYNPNNDNNFTDNLIKMRRKKEKSTGKCIIHGYDSEMFYGIVFTVTWRSVNNETCRIIKVLSAYCNTSIGCTPSNIR